jgi:hypothetical protein
MDEQCIADIAACIASGELIERSKDALDEIYMSGSAECERILSALEVYGSNNFADEFKYCIDEILKICDADKPTKLRSLVFKQRASNPFPSVFAILLLAFHELSVKEEKKISDYGGQKSNYKPVREDRNRSKGNFAG